MRLFRRKKNNKGFSLVEVVCAVAILGLTSTAIGTTMVVSNQNYQRGNAEVDVQKEAQTTTNLIGNLIVDSASVEHKYYKDTTTIEKMTIKGENKEYEITYNKDTGTISYKEKVKVGENVQESSGTLATDVSDFRGDFSNYKEDGWKNVSLELAINKNDRNYEATYSTTSRNGVAKNLGTKKAARITCESEVILEPGQTSFKLPITVHGMDPDDANITWSALSVAEADSYVGTSSVNGDGSGATINIDKNAKGVLQVTVKTNIDPVTDITVNDSKTILVKIRRVNKINITGVRTSGQPSKKDAVYRVNATAVGTSLSKAIGKYYDDGSVTSAYEYKNPKYIDFSFTMSNGLNAADYVEVISKEAVEDTDTPYVEFKLKQSIPVGRKLTVTATSKHAKDGAYNKSKDEYATVTNVYEIENKQGVFTPKSGLERGMDYLDFICSLDRATLESTYGGSRTWLWTYKKSSEDYYPQYYRTLEEGDTPKIHGTESYLLEADEAYDYKLMFALIDWDKKKLMWPHDATLLEPGKGFYEYGITKGWDETSEKFDEASQYEDAYASEFQIGATMIGFTAKGSTISSGTYVNLPYEENKFVTTAGTKDDPIILRKNDSGKNDYMEINFDFENLYKSRYNVELKLEKWNGYDFVDAPNGLMGKLNLKGSDADGEQGKIKINNIAKPDGSNQYPYGEYRIRVGVYGERKGELTNTSSIQKSTITCSNKSWDLSGNKLVTQEDGTEVSMECGYVYFNIEP